MENDLKTPACKLLEIMFIFERLILTFFFECTLSDRSEMTHNTFQNNEFKEKANLMYFPDVVSRGAAVL